MVPSLGGYTVCSYFLVLIILNRFSFLFFPSPKASLLPICPHLFCPFLLLRTDLENEFSPLAVLESSLISVPLHPLASWRLTSPPLFLSDEFAEASSPPWLTLLSPRDCLGPAELLPFLGGLLGNPAADTALSLKGPKSLRGVSHALAPTDFVSGCRCGLPQRTLTPT